MTVAAVILAPTAEAALAPTAGQPRARRLVDIAWSGGALPVVVVAPDADGALARSLADSEAVLAPPAPAEDGPAAQMLRGAELAMVEVADTSAVLLWPAHMTWIGPETITSLIEAHGVERSAILRPSWQGTAGWPVLVPLDLLDAVRASGPELTPDEIVDRLLTGAPGRDLELGDPGAVFDADTPRDSLPAYEGPAAPPAGHVHEWGDGMEGSAEPEPEHDTPGEGRGLPPYPQAAAGGPADI
jgi:CTP:molybdopterin cytidylyltransferase MocA